MKLKLVKTLFLLSLINNTLCFKNVLVNDRLYKRIRISYKKTVRRNSEIVKNTKMNMLYLVKDDLSNDLLYLLKFYNFTDDETNSYFYIIFYELLTFTLKTTKNENVNINLHIMNIITYILLKNLLFNKILHHLFIIK